MINTIIAIILSVASMWAVAWGIQIGHWIVIDYLNVNHMGWAVVSMITCIVAFVSPIALFALHYFKPFMQRH